MNQDICQNQAPDRYFRGNQKEKWTTFIVGLKTGSGDAVSDRLQ